METPNTSEMTSEMKTYPAKATYVVPPKETPTEPHATYPVNQASTSEKMSYPMTSVPIPIKPIYPAVHGNVSSESVPQYYKPTGVGYKTDKTSSKTWSYPTESLPSTGDSSKVATGMGLALGLVMAAMFICA
jgi:hypothetical protein